MLSTFPPQNIFKDIFTCPINSYLPHIFWEYLSERSSYLCKNILQYNFASSLLAFTPTTWLYYNRVLEWFSLTFPFQMAREKRRDLGSAPGQDGMDVTFLARIISRQDHPYPPPPICLFVPASMFLADAFLWLSHGQLNEIPPSSIIMWLDLLWRSYCYFSPEMDFYK